MRNEIMSSDIGAAA